MSVCDRSETFDETVPTLIATSFTCELTIIASIVIKNRLKQAENYGIIRTVHFIHFFVCLVGVGLTLVLPTMTTEFINNICALVFMLEIIFSSFYISPVYPSKAVMLRRKKVIVFIACIWLISTIFTVILAVGMQPHPVSSFSFYSLLTIAIITSLGSGVGYCYLAREGVISAERELINCSYPDDMGTVNTGNYVNGNNNGDSRKEVRDDLNVDQQDRWNHVAEEVTSNHVFQTDYTRFPILIMAAISYSSLVKLGIATINCTNVGDGTNFVNVVIYFALFNSILDFLLNRSTVSTAVK